MTLRVSVVLALPGRQQVVELALPAGSRVAEALAAPATRAMLAGQETSSFDVGIWSRQCGLETALRDGDRVELYRPLAADPKAMRRQRARLKPSTRSRSAR